MLKCLLGVVEPTLCRERMIPCFSFYSFNGKTTDLYSVFEGSIPSRSSINTIIMEEEKKKEEKQMCAIVESTITKMIQAVNDLGIQKEDIVLLTLKGVEWILVYYR